jgi:hypothetical protein
MPMANCAPNGPAGQGGNRFAVHSNGQGSAAILTHPAMADRLPPQNLEAERSCLGSILLEPGRIDEVREIVAVGDFYRDSHQSIFQAMLDLHAAGTPVDNVTVCDELARRGQFEKIGGDEAMREVIESVPHAANARYYAAIVREKSIGRTVIDTCTATLKDAYSGTCTAAELHGRLVAAGREIDAPGTLAAYTPRTFGQVVAKIGEFEHLWPDWLIIGNLSMVYSKPKVGKTRVYIRIIKALWFKEAWPDGAANRWPAGSKTLVIPYDRNHQEIAAEMKCLGVPDEAALCPSDPGDPDGIRLLSLTDPLMLAVLDKSLAGDPAIKLIVVDTLTYASEKSLSKPEDMKAILDEIMVLAARYRVAVWLLIHENKEGKALGRRIDERARVIMKIERYSQDDPKKLRFWVDDGNIAGRPALTATHTDHGIEFSQDEGATGDRANRRDACARWLVQYLLKRQGAEIEFGPLMDALGDAGFAGTFDQAQNRWTDRKLFGRAVDGINGKAESLADLYRYSLERRDESRPGRRWPTIYYRLVTPEPPGAPDEPGIDFRIDDPAAY